MEDLVLRVLRLADSDLAVAYGQLTRVKLQLDAAVAERNQLRREIMLRDAAVAGVKRQRDTVIAERNQLRREILNGDALIQELTSHRMP